MKLNDEWKLNNCCFCCCCCCLLNYLVLKSCFETQQKEEKEKKRDCKVDKGSSSNDFKIKCTQNERKRKEKVISSESKKVSTLTVIRQRLKMMKNSRRSFSMFKPIFA